MLKKRQHQHPRTYLPMCIRTFYLIAAYFRSEVPWKVLRQPPKEEIDCEFPSCGRSMERFTCHRFSQQNWYGLYFLWSICSGNNGTDKKELVKDVFGGEDCFWLQLSLNITRFQQIQKVNSLQLSAELEGLVSRTLPLMQGFSVRQRVGSRNGNKPTPPTPSFRGKSC